MMSMRRVALAGRVEVGDQRLAAALDDRLLAAAPRPCRRATAPFLRLGLLVGVVLDEQLQRVFDAVARRVELRSSNSSRRHSSLPFSSMLRQRHDLGRVQDRRVEAVFERVVQVDAVEHLPRVRAQAERAVRQADVRERAGQVLLDEPDRLERRDGALAGLLLAGGDREHERVEQQVDRRDAVLVDDDVVDALGDLELPLGGVGLALLVDGQRDEGGPVLLGERSSSGRASCGRLRG